MIGVALVAWEAIDIANEAYQADSAGEGGRILLEEGTSLVGGLTLGLAGEAAGLALFAPAGGAAGLAVGAESGPGAAVTGLAGLTVSAAVGTLLLGFIGGWYGSERGAELGEWAADELGLPARKVETTP